MIILVTNRRGHKFKSLEFTSRDLAISSICLNETVVTLKAFIKKCLIINQAELNRLLIKPTAKIEREYIVWEDDNIVFFAKYTNWEILNILYTFYSVPKVSRETLQGVISFNESRSMEIALYSTTLRNFKHKLVEHVLNFYSEQHHYFNANKLIRLAKAMGIDASLVDDKVLLKYKNIEYTSAIGSIFYNEIFIFIKNFQINGFMLRFKDFDFSSYWNIPVVLHPYLLVPYGFNNHLSFLPPQDYKAFIYGVNDMIKGGSEAGLTTLQLIIQDFQDLRRIWGSNKMRAKERVELSKLILEKKVKYDKNG